MTSFEKTNRKFYAAWSVNSGGTTNPLTDGLLTRLGDMCVRTLSRQVISAGITCWQAARRVLNTVMLAGNIDNPDLSFCDRLRDEMLPLMPR